MLAGLNLWKKSLLRSRNLQKLLEKIAFAIPLKINVLNFKNYSKVM
jgi:hypothetical protein